MRSHTSTAHRATCFRLLAAIACAGVLAGCLPEDRLRALRYSPSARQIAYISDKKGLCVASLEPPSSRQVVRSHVQGDSFDWSPDGSRLAYVSDEVGPWNVHVVTLDGATTRVTSELTRQSEPCFDRNGSVYYLSAESGKNELMRDRETTSVLELPYDLFLPALSPDRRRLAFCSCANLRPQLQMMNLVSGQVDVLTSQGDPLALRLERPSWSPQSDAIAYTQQVQDSAGRTATQVHKVEWRGKRISDTVISPTNSKAVDQAMLVADDGVAFVSDGTLTLGQANAKSLNEIPLARLEVSLCAAAPGGENIAVVVEDQLLCTVDILARKPRVFTFDLQDKFLLAEAYFHKGAREKSYELYEELASSVQRTQDPVLTQFVYAANLRRLGRTREAVRVLEQIVAREQLPPSVPRENLWRMLGYSYLLAVNDYSRARSCFEQYEHIVHPRDHRADRPTSATEGTPTARDTTRPLLLDDTALNALAILRRNDEKLTNQFARALIARLEGNVPQTAARFEQLLKMAPDFAPVQAEYLRAPEGYEREVYFFTPTERAYEPTPAQRITYLQRFLQFAPQSPFADQTKLQLFLLYIEGLQFEPARQLLNDELDRTTEPSQLEGITEVFANYLETPESQPWLEAATDAVFLHSTIRPKLEQHITTQNTRMLLYLAAAKLALVKDNADAARQELDRALGAWQLIPESERTAASNRFYARLLVMRGREAESRGLWAEAAGFYDQALEHMQSTSTDEFELFAEIKYRASMIRYSLAEDARWAPDQFAIEKTSSDELVNPSWDVQKLRVGLTAELKRYDDASSSAPSTERALAAYECAILFRKLGRTWQARAGLREAADEMAPAFLREKALQELAALDEDLSDPWNAARWYKRASELPSATSYEQPWAMFNISRLHLKMRYNRSASRQALSYIVSSRPGTPLATRAEELLATSQQ